MNRMHPDYSGEMFSFAGKKDSCWAAFLQVDSTEVKIKQQKEGSKKTQEALGDS